MTSKGVEAGTVNIGQLVSWLSDEPRPKPVFLFNAYARQSRVRQTKTTYSTYWKVASSRLIKIL